MPDSLLSLDGPGDEIWELQYKQLNGNDLQRIAVLRKLGDHDTKFYGANLKTLHKLRNPLLKELNCVFRSKFGLCSTKKSQEPLNHVALRICGNLWDTQGPSWLFKEDDPQFLLLVANMATIEHRLLLESPAVMQPKLFSVCSSLISRSMDLLSEDGDGDTVQRMDLPETTETKLATTIVQHLQFLCKFLMVNADDNDSQIAWVSWEPLHSLLTKALISDSVIFDEDYGQLLEIMIVDLQTWKSLEPSVGAHLLQNYLDLYRSCDFPLTSKDVLEQRIVKTVMSVVTAEFAKLCSSVSSQSINCGLLLLAVKFLHSDLEDQTLSLVHSKVCVKDQEKFVTTIAKSVTTLDVETCEPLEHVQRDRTLALLLVIAIALTLHNGHSPSREASEGFVNSCRRIVFMGNSTTDAVEDEELTRVMLDITASLSNKIS